jgi:hypothetical protein
MAGEWKWCDDCMRMFRGPECKRCKKRALMLICVSCGYRDGCPVVPPCDQWLPHGTLRVTDERAGRT